MKEFGKNAKGGDLSAFGIESITADPKKLGFADGERALRAAVMAVAAGGEPKAVNPTFPSYYQMVGRKLELRTITGEGGVSKPAAEIVFKSGKAFKPAQVALFMNAVNPVPEASPRHKEAPKPPHA